MNKIIFTALLVTGHWSLVTAAGAAAPSVRTLGGAGTYSGISAARSAARTAPSIGSVRAASNRVLGGPARAVDIGSGNTGVGRVASNPATARLSIGSYLNGGKSVSGGSSIKNQNPSQNVSSDGSSEMQEQIDALQREVDNLQDADNDRYTRGESDELLDLKQDLLTPGDGITIDETNTISVNVGDGLSFDADGKLVAAVINGREVMMQAVGEYIQWKYVDETDWRDLIAIADLQGDTGQTGADGIQGLPGLSAYEVAVIGGFTGTQTQWLDSLKGETGAVPDLANYMTQQQIMQAIANAVANYQLKLDTPDTGAHALVSIEGEQTWMEIAL